MLERNARNPVNHRASLFAYAGVVVVLLVLVVGAIASALVMEDASKRAAAAAHQADFFQNANFTIAVEESLEREYRLAPTPQTLTQHREVAVRFGAELRLAKSTPGTPFAQILSDIRASQGAYLSAAQLMFAAVREGNQTLANRIDRNEVDPAFDTVQKVVSREAVRWGAIANRETLRHSRIAGAVVVLTLIVSVTGIAALFIIFAVLRGYRIHIDQAIAEELRRLKIATLTDFLTGLGNFRAYQESLRDRPAERKDVKTPFSIALIDVDELKVVNDRKGHVVGDQVLLSLANVLRSGDFPLAPFRLGGDEFALTFSPMSCDTARRRMEQVRAVVEAELGGTTVSIGVATTTETDDDPLVLREQADAALCEAKRRGRNNVVTFDEIREASAIFLPGRVAEVRELIEGDVMGVAFQPIWDADARGVLGYEALARPAGENAINPQDAFDIAEKIGRAQDLDRVCRHAILRRAGHRMPAGSRLFINVSPQTLDHEIFTGDTLVREVAAAGLRPDQVVLEITERSLARLHVVVREAKRLRALGFGLALDDAGSGNSGLEMLSQLEVDYVKIDREVIVRAQNQGGGRAVLAGIVAIACEMGAQIIAEGIEDSQMLDLVMQATRSSPRPTAVQGYFLGRPSTEFVDAPVLALTQRRLSAADTKTLTVEGSVV